jgi:DUF4097 and DUF4098 domain-containing protein YvlB
VPWDCAVQLGVVTATAVVAGVHGRTSVKSVSGGVTLEGLTDSVEAETISGDLQTRSLAGDLTFGTVSGQLTVVDGSSNRLHANSVSGDLFLDVDVAKHGSLELRTITGDARVRLPRNTDLEVDISSTSGALGTSFDALRLERTASARRLGGVLGTGSARLRATTVSGDVTLLRREPAGAAL